MTLDRRGPDARRSGSTVDDRFLRYWVLWVSIGEAVGFLAPAVTQLAFAGSPVARPTLILAGAVEGAVLGWTQATVLKVPVPALSRSRWVGATALGAAIAWFIGLLPAEWADVWQRWPVTAQVVAGAVGALVLLCCLGVAQLFELRRHLTGAGWWVLGSALAWAAGLLVFFAVATPLWQPGQPGWVTLLVGVLAGVLMAVSMALVTGLVLRRLLRHRNRGGSRN
ncbi:hypothetical protein [Cryobacterium arcticum]|uniref:Uncharacterized protein n=1 Tax=Cryobacterium arcticum TaxID=670052 RepID=A0A317ZZG7_9MICO|nr:hypothetical protein [Cryobacterium arcticum]PXA72723.1 hypothetical protein CTB96_01025 [Cryobacterium arcticum]